jgi:hypothetical protein
MLQKEELRKLRNHKALELKNLEGYDWFGM